jgi:prepilin-type N-terminal cleavage/methylation domain-containing protein
VMQKAAITIADRRSRAVSARCSTGATRPGSVRGFTLIELLVVMGIIVVLAGILLPSINRAYKNSQRLAMNLDFQALIAALENYKADFRDYPKNGFAETDFYTATQSPQANDVYRPDPARVDGSLAMALLGPGPAALTYNNNGTVGVQSSDTNLDMDGADGPGFKSRFSIFGTTSLNAAVTAGVMTITVTATLPTTPYNQTLPPPFTAISLGGPGSPDAAVPVTQWTQQGTITLAAPLQQSYLNGSNVALLAPSGRTWGPYLPADKFKVAYIGFSNDFLPVGSTVATGTQYVPVLLDIWGNQILYFPAYNSYSNHVTATTAQTPSVAKTLSPGINPTGNPALIGPLIGAVSGNYSYNTTLKNPGATGGGSYTGPAVFWDGAANYYLTTVSAILNSTGPANGLYTAPITTGQIEAILYHLGDNQEYITSANNPPNNAINPGETLAVKQPYFLISAGPNGTFEDLQADLTNSPGTTASTAMSKSDDIYSFEGGQ